MPEPIKTVSVTVNQSVKGRLDWHDLRQWAWRALFAAVAVAIGSVITSLKSYANVHATDEFLFTLIVPIVISGLELAKRYFDGPTQAQAEAIRKNGHA